MKKNLVSCVVAALATALVVMVVTACPNETTIPANPFLQEQPKGRTNATVPHISSHPQNAVYSLNAQAVALTVNAELEGGAILSYQWYRNETIIAGAIGTAYIPPTDTLGTAYYYVEVTNTIKDNGDGGSKAAVVRSNTARIEVNEKVNAAVPLILSHPQNAEYRIGAQAAALTVSASVEDGGTLSYQWYRNEINNNQGGTIVNGATRTSYTPPTNTAGTAYYYAEMTNNITDNGDGGNKTAVIRGNTAGITVNPSSPAGTTDPTVTWPEGLMSLSGRTLANISLVEYTNDGGTPGEFTWTTPSDLVGALGTQLHNMTFTPDNTVQYNTVTNDVPVWVSLVEMVFVKGGSFQMGKNGDGSSGNVTPVHTVTLSAFYIGKYELTQAQYQLVTGTNPSYYTAVNYNPPWPGHTERNRPVENVSWYDAVVFCNTLSMVEGLSPAYSIGGSTDPSAWGIVPTSPNMIWDDVIMVAGSNGYRLPTEAQWEYAAKGGDGSPGNYLYAGSNNPDEVAWFYSGIGSGNYSSAEVGKLKPNGLGLYDMSGNAPEWCWDWHGPYPSGAQTDPVGPSTGTLNYGGIPTRVYRGSNKFGDYQGWGQPPVPSTERYYGGPYMGNGNYSANLGLRLARPFDPSDWYSPIVNAASPHIAYLQNATYTYGDTATALTVNASVNDGGILTYQWFRNETSSNQGGTIIGGITETSYTPPTNTTGTAYYYVEITNTITDNGDGGTKTVVARSNTAMITVNKANPSAWPTGLTARYGQTLANISLAAYTNNNTGTFTWTTPSTSVGRLGMRSHNMTFTPDDPTNYNTVTQSVAIRVLLGVEMVWVPGGSFQMGQNGDGTSGNVTPVHPVTLTGFYMGKYELTQYQWQSIMEPTPVRSTFIGDNRPVGYVEWYGAVRFCNHLSEYEGLQPAYHINGNTDPDTWGPYPWDTIEVVSGSNGYRLPTEAQWEYAAKGGNGSTENYIYAGSNDREAVAWYYGNTNTNHEVGTKAPNGLTLYNMSGNVAEWCWDRYGSYSGGAQTNPMGADSGADRVRRGGGVLDLTETTRSVARDHLNPSSTRDDIGFRLVRP